MQESNLLINPNYTGVPQYRELSEYDNKSMNSLIDNIIFKSKDYLTGQQLKQLNDTLISVLNGYELLNVKTESEYKDWKTTNTELLNLFIQSKSIEGCSNRTIKYYDETINKFLEYICKGFNEITSDDIREYLYFKMEQDHISNSSADNIRRVLNACFTWLSNEGYITINPVIGVSKIRSKKKLKQPFTDLEVEKLRDVLIQNNNTIQGKRNLAIFELLLSSGMRIGECMNIMRNDVDWRNNSIIVLGKGAKERECYFNTKTKIRLQEYLDVRKDGNPYLFVASKKPYNQLGVNGVERMIRDIGIEAGVKAHPHKFRRTMATNLLKKGVPIEQVKVLLGHENIETTTIYALVDDNEVQFNHRRLMD